LLDPADSVLISSSSDPISSDLSGSLLMESSDTMIDNKNPLEI
jgi:hypothetical protein